MWPMRSKRRFPHRHVRSGIKDGLDDGTFLDTIEEQNARISRLVERLLSLSRIESREYPLSPIALDTILHKCMEDQRMALHARGLSFQEELACDVEIMGNSELVALLFPTCCQTR